MGNLPNSTGQAGYFSIHGLLLLNLLKGLENTDDSGSDDNDVGDLFWFIYSWFMLQFLGKVISQKKDELNHILDQFNIQVVFSPHLKHNLNSYFQQNITLKGGMSQGFCCLGSISCLNRYLVVLLMHKNI